MKGIRNIAAALVLLVMTVTGIFWFGPGSSLEQGMIIATAVPVEIDLNTADFGTDDRYIPTAKIIALDPENKEADPIILTGDFHSARSPQASYDAKLLLFSGQKAEEDTWQIYRLDLQSLDIQQVTDCPVNCTDPAWLPDGRILFSRLNEEDSAGPVHVLYRCEVDGSNMERLTFHPNSVMATSLFQDGRILMQNEQKYPETGNKKLLAMRIDGTKAELFYDLEPGSTLLGRAWEASDGRMYFVIRKGEGSMGGILVSVAKGNPMNSFLNHSDGVKGEFHSVYPSATGSLIVAHREMESDAFRVGVFDLKTNSIRDVIQAGDKFHVLEPVLLESRSLPMILPEVVDHTQKRGTLLCFDASLSADNLTDPAGLDNRTDKVQVYGREGLLAEIPVEEDGSFYIEIDADTPVRFQTVNANRELLRGPSDWIWVRPNEKRSCIGCHEDRALAPENKVPQALYTGMVSIPEGIRAEAIDVNGKHIKDYDE